MMTPQLFINYKLKSVAHLPWRMMTYKALNTFIDDIFAFVIKMPTMYRLGCFRDDIVFFIFLYQKYMYRVSFEKRVSIFNSGTQFMWSKIPMGDFGYILRKIHFWPRGFADAVLGTAYLLLLFLENFFEFHEKSGHFLHC